MIHRSALALLLLLALPAGATDYILPVFAFHVPGEGGSVWTSEVWVTNAGPNPAVVYEGTLIGRTTGAPPCAPLVQPSLVVDPYTTEVWPIEALALGIGCPETAAGALSFRSEEKVEIGSRIVNTRGDAVPPGLLRGYGQEVTAIAIPSLPRGPLLLPAAAWHANSCGQSSFDTNVFLANTGPTTLHVSIDVEPGGGRDIVIDGAIVPAPFAFTVEPNEFRQHRIAGPDLPLAVCLPPTVGAFLLEMDGGLAVIGSVIDRSTGDARTVVPIEASR